MFPTFLQRCRSRLFALSLLLPTLVCAQAGNGLSVQLASTSPCPAASFSGLPASYEKARRIVTDAPYSGVGRNSITRVLADGNRIVHSNTTRYFRDGRGRTRTEYVLAMVGPIPLGRTHTIIVINDPVEARSYVLHQDTKSAEVHELSMSGLPLGNHSIQQARSAITPIPSDPKTSSVDLPCNLQTAPAPAPMPLGEKSFGDIKARGIRVESTIPAGQIGNERPITIRTEEWFSERLGVVMAMTSQDPMVGDSSYRLEQIVLAEPEPSLFKVPADYTIQPMPPAQSIPQLPRP